MNNKNLDRIVILIFFCTIVFININHQKNILTSIRALSLQCKSTYNITIPNDDGIEKWSEQK